MLSHLKEIHGNQKELNKGAKIWAKLMW